MDLLKVITYKCSVWALILYTAL